MTEAFLALVPVYGPWLLFVVTFLSCLALPVPSSLMMLAAGGFSASGDLAFWGVTVAAFAGATIGDQAGFVLGRAGGPALLNRIGRKGRRGAVIGRARQFLNRRGGVAVFLTRWLFSPVGPWTNFVAGAGGIGWARFTVWGALGEAVWVGLYTGTGRLFAGNLHAAADLLTSGLGFVGALAVTLGLGLWLRAVSAHHEN